MTDKKLTALCIETLARTLILTDSDAERQEQLEKFDDDFGFTIHDWADRLKTALSSMEHNASALNSLEQYYSKYHKKDENGATIYERIRYGNDYHRITITFDASKPEEEQFQVTECPDVENMNLSELEAYYRELEIALEDLLDAEVEDDLSDEYEQWEDQRSDIEDLMDEIEERVEALGGIL